MQENLNLDIARLFMEGGQIGADGAKKLNKQLLDNPSDVSARLKLAGYHLATLSRNEFHKTGFVSQLVWLIENMPTNPDLEIINSLFHKDNSHFQKGKRAWLEAVDLHPGNTSVLNNAATYCQLVAPEISQGLWERACALEPENSAWPRHLSALFRLRAQNPYSDEHRNYALRAIQALNHAIALHEEHLTDAYLEVYKDMEIDMTIDCAIQFGFLEEAKCLGEYLVRSASIAESKNKNGQSLKRSPRRRWAEHMGRSMLGRILLHLGEKESAKQQLAKLAGLEKSTYSLHYNRFLDELGKAGEIDALLEHIDLIVNEEGNSSQASEMDDIEFVKKIRRKFTKAPSKRARADS